MTPDFKRSIAALPLKDKTQPTFTVVLNWAPWARVK